MKSVNKRALVKLVLPWAGLLVFSWLRQFCSWLDAFVMVFSVICVIESVCWAVSEGPKFLKQSSVAAPLRKIHDWMDKDD